MWSLTTCVRHHFSGKIWLHKWNMTSDVWHDSFTYVWHGSFIRVTSLIHKCTMTHSSVYHDSFMSATYVFPSFFVPWLICKYDLSYSCVMRCMSMTSAVYVCCMFQKFDVTHFIRIWDMPHLCVGHDLFIRGSWLIPTRDMTHSHLWHDSLISDCSPTFAASERLLQLECCAFVFGIWLTHTWDMTHPYVEHDSFICGTWLVHMISDCDTNIVAPKRLLRLECCGFAYVSHLCVRHNSFICETWLIHMWDMTHSYIGHDAFIWYQIATQRLQLLRGCCA